MSSEVSNQTPTPAPGSAHNDAPGSVYRRWLHYFAIAMVVMIFFLIVAGGTVTTYGYGLAVPDWPTSYGKWFLLPLDLWQRVDIFWEHNHRLLGAVVGLMAIAFVPAIFKNETRWWMGAFAITLLLLIIAQGLMGGFRVTEAFETQPFGDVTPGDIAAAKEASFGDGGPAMPSNIALVFAVLHGVTGQLIFAMTVFGAAALGKWWLLRSPKSAAEANVRTSVKPLLTGQDQVVAIGLLALLVIQLSLGAIVRHYHAGLAIPDFPLMYGGFLPPMTQASLDEAIANLPEGYDVREGGLALWQVHLHFGHRLGALIVFCWSLWVVARMMRLEKLLPAGGVKGPMVAYVVLLLLQISLGVLVIWTGRHGEVTTAHQSVGAALLGTATLMVTRMFRLDYLTRHPEAALAGQDGGEATRDSNDSEPSSDLKGAPA